MSAPKILLCWRREIEVIAACLNFDPSDEEELALGERLVILLYV